MNRFGTIATESILGRASLVLTITVCGRPGSHPYHGHLTNLLGGLERAYDEAGPGGDHHLGVHTPYFGIRREESNPCVVREFRRGAPFFSLTASRIDEKASPSPLRYSGTCCELVGGINGGEESGDLF